jgi:hypothetical protein
MKKAEGRVCWVKGNDPRPSALLTCSSAHVPPKKSTQSRSHRHIHAGQNL